MKKRKLLLSALIALPVLALGLAGCGANQSSQSASPSNDEKSTQVDKASNVALTKTYNVGQTVNYKGLALKVDHVYYWGGDDVNTPDNGKQYVMAKITAKNNGNKSKDCNSYSFSLDDNGSNGDWDEYLDNDTPHGGQDFGSSNSLDPGASKTGFLYGQAKQGDKLALKYQPSTLNDNKKITVNLN